MEHFGAFSRYSFVLIACIWGTFVMTQILSANAEVCEVETLDDSCDAKQCLADCQKDHGANFIDAICQKGNICLCFFNSAKPCNPGQKSRRQHRTLQMY
ncbi:hypothetical protein P3S68_012717 [Capsicum galapagoense]